MARKLEDFIASLPEVEQQAIQQETERLIAEEMTLQALRHVRAQSQEQIGHSLHIKQAAVSRLERRTDMYVSTLRSFIEAMGGNLEIIARFPDHTPVRITQFEALDNGIPVHHSASHDLRRALVRPPPRRARSRAAHKRRQPVPHR